MHILYMRRRRHCPCQRFNISMDTCFFFPNGRFQFWFLYRYDSSACLLPIVAPLPYTKLKWTHGSTLYSHIVYTAQNICIRFNALRLVSQRLLERACKHRTIIYYYGVGVPMSLSLFSFCCFIYFFLFCLLIFGSIFWMTFFSATHMDFVYRSIRE